jgi:glycosyltransferase involved in cell wall biosynthesis
MVVTYFNYADTIFTSLIILQIGIFFSLIYFLIYSIKSIKNIPKIIPIANPYNIDYPLVSVILPCRNEEKYIGKCLDSLLVQDYPNYEIIVINDSSSDKTGDIIKSYSLIHDKIIYVDAQPKPEGWTGKNWACYQGYLQANGDLFLFTDADSIHSAPTMSLAINHMLSKELDSITVIPKIVANDFWTKITLPILWTFSVARFSAIKANNSKTKEGGFFFGSFFIITKKVYESVGTHRSVRDEIVEDAELGRKVKTHGYSLSVIHGERYLSAIWARDPSNLYQGLKRLLIPLYKKERIKASVMGIATFVLLLLPVIILPFLIAIMKEETERGADLTKSLTTLIFITISISLIVINSFMQLKYIIFQNVLYSLAFPLAGSFILVAFVSSIIHSKHKDAITWRDRRYSINHRRP